MILDTNALSAAADREPTALKVVAGAERLAVPVIVLGEYRLGIAQSRHRKDYENWLREWIAAVRVLDVDERTTHHYATIGLELKGMGKPIPTNGVCQVLCVNDLDFVVGFGFGFGFGVVLGFGFVLGVVVGFGDGVQGKGAISPSLAYSRRRIRDCIMPTYRAWPCALATGR